MPSQCEQFPRPECGVLGFFIGELTSKSALLSLTLLSAREGLKSVYYFILHQGRLLFAIVFVIFLWNKCYFVQIFTLYMNIPTNLFLIEFPS